jgi:hypothetical protein
MRPWMIVSCVLFAFGAASAEETGHRLAQRIATLRAQIESLHADLIDERSALRESERSYEVRKSELEGQVRTQRLETEAAERELSAARKARLEAINTRDALKPSVAPAIAALRQAVEQGIPFRKDDRLAALNAIEAQVNAGAVDAGSAITRLWQHVEDELRLTRENTLDRTTINLDGADRYVTVARLGMVTMLFQGEDGVCGTLQREGDAWRWVQAQDPAHIAQIHELFEAFDKQGRTGWVELPWSLPQVTP